MSKARVAVVKITTGQLTVRHHIRVIDAATGELIRELTIDPTRDYQPTGNPRGPQK